MKKWMIVILALLLVLSFSACKAEEAEEPAATETQLAAEPVADRTQNSDYVFIALITDGGPVDDAALNHSCWVAVEDFAKLYSFDHAYYKPETADAAGRQSAIEAAIADGASTLVCPGPCFVEVVSQLYSVYPDINFLLVDVGPQGSSGASPANNVYSLHYREEEAGFLAGYAAVNEGLLNLGFMGGAQTDGELRYGYGFIRGADYAAGLLSKEVSLRFAFSGSDDPSEAACTECTHWYEDGVQAIFCPGGNMYRSVVQAAEAAPNRWVIAADVDRSSVSKTVLISARKGYYSSTYNALSTLMDNEWTWGELGGTVATLGLTEKALNLPTDGDIWRFKTFKVNKYEDLLKKITEDGEVTVNGDITNLPETAHTQVNYLQ